MITPSEATGHSAQKLAHIRSGGDGRMVNICWEIGPFIPGSAEQDALFTEARAEGLQPFLRPGGPLNDLVAGPSGWKSIGLYPAIILEELTKISHYDHGYYNALNDIVTIPKHVTVGACRDILNFMIYLCDMNPAYHDVFKAAPYRKVNIHRLDQLLAAVDAFGGIPAVENILRDIYGANIRNMTLPFAVAHAGQLAPGSPQRVQMISYVASLLAKRGELTHSPYPTHHVFQHETVLREVNVVLEPDP